MAKDYTARAAGLRAVRLDLTDEEHRAFRARAGAQGLTMTALAKQLVLAEVAKGVVIEPTPKKRATKVKTE